MSFRLKFSLPVRVAGIFLALFLSGNFPAKAQVIAAPQRSGPPRSLSPVIIAERPDAVQGYNADPAQVRIMVNRCLMTLTSAPDVGTAWTRLGITPQDVVGIKIATAGGPFLSTHRSVIRAICDGLQAAGVPSSQIIIWDKFQGDMTAAGYTLHAAADGQPAVASVSPGDNYDANVFYHNGIRGSLIWGDHLFSSSLDLAGFDSSMRSRSFYTTFVTQTCTKIINVPVLNHNERFGIDACLSNIALGSTDNNRRFLGEPNYGDPWIPEMYDQSFIRRKVVVNILDALTAQCAGGPPFNPLFCQSFGAIYVGRDPVAIDSLALPRLEKMRRNLNVISVGDISSYLTSASVLGLGTTDRRRIQFLRVR